MYIQLFILLCNVTASKFDFPFLVIVELEFVYLSVKCVESFYVLFKFVSKFKCPNIKSFFVEWSLT